MTASHLGSMKCLKDIDGCTQCLAGTFRPPLCSLENLGFCFDLCLLGIFREVVLAVKSSSTEVVTNSRFGYFYTGYLSPHGFYSHQLIDSNWNLY